MRQFRSLWQNSAVCQNIAHLMSAWMICCKIGWLVCGVRETRVQHRLLAEPNLTFKKGFEICQSAEVAETNARELQMSQRYKVPLLLGYHQSSHGKEPATPLPCYWCGGKQHSAQYCRFKTAECHHCRKKGHIGKVCRSKNQRGQHQQGPGSSVTAKTGRTHHVDEVPPLAEVEDILRPLH